MKNHLIISLRILSVGFSQQEYNSNDLIYMDNGLWTEKFSEEPITGKVYGYFGESEPYKKVYIGNLLNGKREGRWVVYHHSTGKKEYDYNYKDGEHDGLSTVWYENGRKKSEGTYKDGERDGLSNWWYENGQKESEGTYKGGNEDGLHIEWYENGQKKSEGTYKDGNKDGLWTSWYKNGQKKDEFTWKDGETVEKIGIWNEDGSPL